MTNVVIRAYSSLSPAVFFNLLLFPPFNRTWLLPVFDTASVVSIEFQESHDNGLMSCRGFTKRIPSKTRSSLSYLLRVFASISGPASMAWKRKKDGQVTLRLEGRFIFQGSVICYIASNAKLHMALVFKMRKTVHTPVPQEPLPFSFPGRRESFSSLYRLQQ